MISSKAMVQLMKNQKTTFFSHYLGTVMGNRIKKLR